MLSDIDFNNKLPRRLLDENFIRPFITDHNKPLPLISETDIQCFEADLIIDNYFPPPKIIKLNPNLTDHNPIATHAMSNALPLSNIHPVRNFNPNLNTHSENSFQVLLLLANSKRILSSPQIPSPNQGLHKLAYYISYSASEKHQTLTLKATNILGRSNSLKFLEIALRLYLSTSSSNSKKNTLAGTFLQLIRESDEVASQQKTHIFAKSSKPNRSLDQNYMLLSPISFSSSESEEENLVISIPNLSYNLTLPSPCLVHNTPLPKEEMKPQSSSITPNPTNTQTCYSDITQTPSLDRIPLFMVKQKF